MSPFLEKARTIGLVALGFLIGAGQLAETGDLLSNAYVGVSSLVTHENQYDMLSQIQVGNTVAYAESLLGDAQVSTRITDDITANYFYHRKFLLTLFYSDERIVAKTLMPLIESFDPEVAGLAGESHPLSEFTFATFNQFEGEYYVDSSRLLSYYIEAFHPPSNRLNEKVYVGHLAYDHESELIADIAALYNAVLEDNEDARLVDQLRQATHVNFYGEGNLDLNLIRRSILSRSQLSLYFRQ